MVKNLMLMDGGNKMEKKEYGPAHVEELEKKLERAEKKLYDARAELVGMANQVGFVLKEVGSSPAELVPMDKDIYDTITVSDARNVRDINFKKLVGYVLARDQEAREIQQALEQYRIKYGNSQKQDTGLYEQVRDIQAQSAGKTKALEQKVRKMAQDANKLIDEQELLIGIQYDLLREDGKVKWDELDALVHGNGKKDSSDYIRELNQTLDERDKAEGSRRSALGWNTRYREEIKELKQEIKELKNPKKH